MRRCTVWRETLRYERTSAIVRSGPGSCDVVMADKRNNKLRLSPVTHLYADGAGSSQGNVGFLPGAHARQLR